MTYKIKIFASFTEKETLHAILKIFLLNIMYSGITTPEQQKQQIYKSTSNYKNYNKEKQLTKRHLIKYGNLSYVQYHEKKMIKLRKKKEKVTPIPDLLDFGMIIET